MFFIQLIQKLLYWRPNCQEFHLKLFFCYEVKKLFWYLICRGYHQPALRRDPWVQGRPQCCCSPPQCCSEFVDTSTVQNIDDDNIYNDTFHTCKATGHLTIFWAACIRALLLLCSPSAAITFTIAFYQCCSSSLESFLP